MLEAGCRFATAIPPSALALHQKGLFLSTRANEHASKTSIFPMLINGTKTNLRFCSTSTRMSPHLEEELNQRTLTFTKFLLAHRPTSSRP